jgi:hypothetical protein
MTRFVPYMPCHMHPGTGLLLGEKMSVLKQCILIRSKEGRIQNKKNIKLANEKSSKDRITLTFLSRETNCQVLHLSCLIFYFRGR